MLNQHKLNIFSEMSFEIDKIKIKSQYQNDNKIAKITLIVIFKYVSKEKQN